MNNNSNNNDSLDTNKNLQASSITDTAGNSRSEREIFFQAFEIVDNELRDQFLRDACGDNQRLLAGVRKLLEESDSESRLFIDQPLFKSELIGAVAGETRRAGSTIGPYALEKRLGEGGMGEVWLAKQHEPVKRRVAVKLVRPGRESPGVLQRFEAERQALAAMDHPGIARVLDARTTDSGQPCFVMELVNGAPLIQFCDEARLTIHERLEIFVQVAQAVQHAHQKAIIHRDLKPSNILVTVIDGRPVPKIIDFGLAKALRGKLTVDSLSTQFGMVIGTLEYMAPEQAGYSGQDVDTRADIYSLGVILYELLTGLRPFESSRFKDAPIDEMLRIIKEDEPVSPSTRLSTSDSALATATIRRTEPAKLSSLLRNDLDWIVMKALEKDRSRRYQTANDLGEDVGRYLVGEPVAAHPPSRAYRVGKFVNKHKGLVAALAAIGAALVLGSAGTMYGLFRANANAVELSAEAEKSREAARMTRQAIKSFFFETTQSGVFDTAENESLNLQLEELANQFYGALIENNPEDRQLENELIAIQLHLNHHRIQLDPKNFNYEELQQIVEKLAEADPNVSFEELVFFAKSLQWAANLIQQYSGDMESIATTRRAVNLVRENNSPHPNKSMFLCDLLSNHAGVIYQLWFRSDSSAQDRLHDEFRQAIDEAHQILQRENQLPPSKTADANLVTASAVLELKARAATLRWCFPKIPIPDNTDPEFLQAVEFLKQSTELLQRNLILNPDSNHTAIRLVSIGNLHSQLLAQAGLYPEAVRVAEQGIGVIEPIAKARPDRFDIRVHLFRAMYHKGVALLRMGKYRECEEYCWDLYQSMLESPEDQIGSLDAQFGDVIEILNQVLRLHQHWERLLETSLKQEEINRRLAHRRTEDLSIYWHKFTNDLHLQAAYKGLGNLPMFLETNQAVVDQASAFLATYPNADSTLRDRIGERVAAAAENLVRHFLENDEPEKAERLLPLATEHAKSPQLELWCKLNHLVLAVARGNSDQFKSAFENLYLELEPRSARTMTMAINCDHWYALLDADMSNDETREQFRRQKIPDHQLAVLGRLTDAQRKQLTAAVVDMAMGYVESLIDPVETTNDTGGVILSADDRQHFSNLLEDIRFRELWDKTF